MSSIEELKADLWNRWRDLLQNPVLVRPTELATMMYSRTSRFELKDWTPKAFPSGGRLSSEPIPGADNYVYYLDKNGLPRAMSFRHSVNAVDWVGEYRYAPEWVQYVEICLQSNIPSCLRRVTVRDQQLASYQELTINSGGHFRAWLSMDRNELLEKIMSDPCNWYICVEEYQTQDGVIRSGNGYLEGLGVSARHLTLSFLYSEEGKLERVLGREEGGTDRTMYAAPSDTSLEQLSENLSRRLAEKVITVLKQTTFDSPLVAVELSFQSADEYVPVVIPFTEKDRISSFPALDANTKTRPIELETEDFEPEMTEFTERISESEEYDLGTKMLREAARLLTTRKGTIPVAEGFLAYAIDWELEEDEFSKVLTDCGADAKSLALWEERGWLS